MSLGSGGRASGIDLNSWRLSCPRGARVPTRARRCAPRELTSSGMMSALRAIGTRGLPDGRAACTDAMARGLHAIRVCVWPRMALGSRHRVPASRRHPLPRPDAGDGLSRVRSKRPGVFAIRSWQGDPWRSIHQAIRFRGKANYREALYLAHGKTVEGVVSSFTRDMADVLEGFLGVAGGFTFHRLGADLSRSFWRTSRSTVRSASAAVGLESCLSVPVDGSQSPERAATFALRQRPSTSTVVERQSTVPATIGVWWQGASQRPLPPRLRRSE